MLRFAGGCPALYGVAGVGRVLTQTRSRAPFTTTRAQQTLIAPSLRAISNGIAPCRSGDGNELKSLGCTPPGGDNARPPVRAHDDR